MGNYHIKLPLGKIICGHALTVAPSIPNDTVSCMVTSPPYWAKRKYAGDGIIWDGDVDCKHRRGENVTFKSGRYRDWKNEPHHKDYKPIGSISVDLISKYQFCIKCGAWRGQLGHEPTVSLYIQHLMQVFDEMYRILRKDGNLFVVIADTRSRGTRPKKANWEDSFRKRKDNRSIEDKVRARARSSTLNLSKDRSKSQTFIPSVGVSTEPDLKPDYRQPDKSQCCVPEIFKLAMMGRGWIARSTYVWVKTNPKPESVKDRFTDCFEYVYHFIKHKKYFFDMQYEPAVCSDDRRAGGGRVEYDGKHLGEEGTGERAFVSVDALRQMRGAFIGPIQPYKGAHFATYPEWLIEPLIKAGCPTHICKKCGKIAKPIYETRKVKRKRLHDTTEPCKEAGQSPNDYASVVGYTSKFTDGKFGEAAPGLSSGARFEKERARSRDIAKELHPNDPKAQQDYINYIHNHGRSIASRKIIDYDTCNCKAGWRTGVVFDPFMGAGTTAVVAERLGFDWIGIELSKQYIKMSYKRLNK